MPASAGAGGVLACTGAIRDASEGHRTAWIEAGPADGPLMIFIHGWPELGLVWRAQLAHFAAAGRLTLRGADMVGLHDALGGQSAIWVGHDWGSAVAWAMASHHAERCRGVVNLCVPYLARGLALPNLIPLADRAL